MIADDARVEEGTAIGAGTQVWHLAHIRRDAVIGANCIVGGGAFIDHGVIIGDGCKIQNGALLFAPATLGNGVFIGPGAIFTNDRTPRAVSPTFQPMSASDWQAAGVTISDGASVGANATIVDGVAIGRWAMIAAGAVVTRDVLSHELVAGVPARNLGWVDRDGQRLEPDSTSWVSPSGTRYEMHTSGLKEVAA
jgi:acetyltransferase-like isoleucine patch superfamily enzyme